MGEAGHCAAASILLRGGGHGGIPARTAAANFFFMEIEHPIQVEHPVTEMVTGVYLIAEATAHCRAAEPLKPGQRNIRLWATRSNAASTPRIPAHFRPVPGRSTGWLLPADRGVRVDSHVYHRLRNPPPSTTPWIGK